MLFWNPECGYCTRLLDDVRALERAARDGDGARLLLVSSGGEAANAALGLASPIALDDAFALGRAVGAAGTPSAVLVDAEGCIASAVAVGGPSVLELAQHTSAAAASTRSVAR